MRRASATELRKDFTLEGGEYLGHVADFVFAHGRVAIHGQDAEDELLVFDIALGNQLLEAFPVFTHALDGGIQGIVALGDLVPGLGSALGTVTGELVVQFLGTFGGGVGHNLRALDGGTLIGVGGVQGGQELLDGGSLQFGIANLGAVYLIFDLTLGRGHDHILIVVLLEGHVPGALDQHIGGVGTIGHLAGGQVDGLLAGQYAAAELQMALFHTFYIVEVEALRYFLAFGRNHFVVVLHLFALILEGLHGRFTTFVHNHGGDFQDYLGIEIILGVSNRHDGVDGSVNHLQDRGLAGHLDIVGHFGHLFRRRTGYGKRSGGEENQDFFHMLQY